MDKRTRMTRFIKDMESEGCEFSRIEMELIESVYMNSVVLIPRQCGKKRIIDMIAKYEINKIKENIDN